MSVDSTQGWEADLDGTLTSGDDTAESGAGGGIMAVWTQDRVSKINQLAQASYSNQSAYSVPNGVIDTEGWQIGFSNHEQHHGINVVGTAIGVGGSPLSGEARVDAGDSTVSSRAVTGAFVMSATAPPGVESGDTESTTSYDFKFVPSIAGVNYTATDIGANYTAGPFQYGAVEGTVTDYNGNVVSDAKVSGSGALTKTAADGTYKLLAPGGTTVPLEAVGDTDSRTPNGGQSITVDWQYAQLKVRVVTPDLDPVSGTPVTINGRDYLTDENGEVTLNTAAIGDYDIDVDDGVETATVSVSGQGNQHEKQFGDTYAAARVILSDQGSRQDIAAIPLAFENGVSAESGSDGEAAVVTPDAGETTVVIDPAGERYNTTEVEVSLTKGSTVEKQVRLEQDVTIGGN
jgi:hypothetical protein